MRPATLRRFVSARSHIVACALALLSLAAPSWAEAALASRFVATADGARIHYLEGGVANGRPAVLFVPGWTWTADVWVGQMERIAARHRVVAMDPRSQGESSKVADGNTPEVRATDIAALIAELGPAPVVLVGWSQGVQDVAAYVEQFGTARLAGIVLVDSALSAGTAALDPAGTKQLLDRISILAEYPAEYMAAARQAARARPMPDAERDRWVAHARKTPTTTAIAMLVADLLGKDRRGAAAKIDRPARVIAAASSPELAEQKALAGAIPGAQFVVVEEAGHAVFLDQPETFGRALEAFLIELTPG